MRSDVSTPRDPARPGLAETVLSLWTWLVVVALVLGIFLLQLVLAPLTWPFDRRRVLTGRLFRMVGVGTSLLSPLWSFRVWGPLPAKPPRRTVVLGNHCSSSDPFLISRLPWEMKWLAKASMFRIPVVGWAMRLAGDVPVVRGDRGSGGEALRRCARWLERGMPVMIFPEGTRSADGSLGPFKDGAFRLAIETGADILPIAVTGTAQALPKKSWRLGRAHGRVAVGTSIPTAGLTLEDVPTLKKQAREQIEELLASMRAEPHLAPAAWRVAPSRG